ncbi:PREDICTED: F-box/kelch-repeat protein At2g43270-like [Camelina sativa]|uniref:F-box/kelch-repeat protein At2g43270-like n=1 Tax=Camelina sativa TaxID=90675 RepID=A0ABM0ZAT0_CAMSA|nr:PREDICTED: F-box/kelch-repeat protein At2g43270-like [Camelina sativa]
MNSIDFASDPLKEIFVRLPLKSLGKLKTVSKEWRSILESKSFIEMHLSFQKSRRRQKVLAAYKCDCCDRPNLSPVSVMEGDEEIVNLHCDSTERPLMNYEGLLCIPEPDWVNVLNPSTGELRRFPSGPVPEPSLLLNMLPRSAERGLAFFPGYWAMGFGKDRVTGSYKVVRMLFDPVECDILDVQTGGEWRKLSPPPYDIDAERRSACVNGTIYWLRIGGGYKILALDLHTEEFHDVASIPKYPYGVTHLTQLLNLDDCLVMSTTRNCEKELEIWFMYSKDERWSKTYSISLADVASTLHPLKVWWFTPVAISKEGNVLICDDKKNLFKHYPHTNTTRRLSHSTCCVIAPYLKNLVRLH